MRTKTGFFGILVAAIVLVTLCPLLRQESRLARAADKRTIRIGMVAKSEANDVFQAAHTGALDAAKELGEKDGVNIEIDWRTPPTDDAAKQADAINSLANDNVDGITVSCSEARMLNSAIDDAVDKGVTVVCFDSDAPKSKRLCDYGTDDTQLGHLLMSELARIMEEKGTIAILAGRQTAPNLQLRVKAVREELAKYPNMHELNGDGNGVGFYHEETPGAAAQEISSVMAANEGKIDAWVFVGGWPLFTDNALQWKPPGSIKVVSVDAPPKTIGIHPQRIRAGTHLAGLLWLGPSNPSKSWLIRFLNNKDPEGMNPQPLIPFPTPSRS